MFKTPSSTLLALSLFIGFAACTGARTGSENKITGTVSDIRSVITVRDTAGRERIFEIASAAGINIGAAAWCEDDNCRLLRIEDKIVNVQKVIK